MINVERLTKRYPGHTAVQDLSFQVAKGEIVGFLGPNGAGKSTTMRILTGFLPATSGSASIAGFDVFTHSIQAREHIGYMPENVPLYTDMRVSEYLAYRGALKGVKGRRMKERMTDVLELCNLTEVRSKIIGNLSKGFRQRVGLADALINEPALLILDEPTSGLDPNQIRQARDLIKNLGKRHTILLSTHILPEVEMTCSRVIIIDKGKIVASGKPEELMKGIRTAGDVRVEIQPGADDAVTLIKAIPGVKDVIEDATEDENWKAFVLRTEAEKDVRQTLYKLAVERKWPVRELSKRRATLEDVFVEITHSDAH